VAGRRRRVVIGVKNIIADVAPASPANIELQVTTAAAALDPYLNFR
jgi:hypothetical protein